MIFFFQIDILWISILVNSQTLDPTLLLTRNKNLELQKWIGEQNPIAGLLINL